MTTSIVSQHQQELEKNMAVEEKYSFWKIPTFRQSFVIIAIIAVMFSSGISVGTATVMLPQLKKSKTDILVDDTMASWIYSVQGFGSIPVVLSMPYLNQWKGYKLTCFINCMPAMISYVLQYFASTSIHLLIVAILQGMTMGGNLCIGIMAITEYSEPRFRSMFFVIKSASYFWGIWIANIIGTFLYWRYIPVIGIIPVLFSFFSCFLWPEGPYWLASKGRIDECKDSFVWLRGPGNGTEELASIIKAQTSENKKIREAGNILTRLKKVLILREFYMPVFINCILYCLYYFSGKTVFAVYALIIIKEITKNESSAYTGMLIIDAITVIGMYIGSYVAMKVRRRNMFLITSAITVFFLYVLAIYLSLVEYQVIIQNKIVSLVLLVVYSFCVSWGPMVLSTSFTSEITPMRFKSFVMSAGSVVFYLLHSVCLKIAPVLFSNCGMHGTFAVYGTLTLICLLYLNKYLPETSNKTLQELETYFVINKHENDTSESVNNTQLLNKY